VNKWNGNLPLATGGAIPFINLGSSSPPYNDKVTMSTHIDSKNVIHQITYNSASKEIYYRNCTKSMSCSNWFNITEVK
jgi:hypothetical protein